MHSRTTVSPDHVLRIIQVPTRVPACLATTPGLRAWAAAAPSSPAGGPHSTGLPEQFLVLGTVGGGKKDTRGDMYAAV